MRDRLTNHHIRSRATGGTNNPKNITRIYSRPHNKFHQVFEEQTLQEQVSTLFYLSYTAITDRVKYDMLKIMEADDEYVYEKGVIKPKYMK